MKTLLKRHTDNRVPEPIVLVSPPPASVLQYLDKSDSLALSPSRSILASPSPTTSADHKSGPPARSTLPAVCCRKNTTQRAFSPLYLNPHNSSISGSLQHQSIRQTHTTRPFQHLPLRRPTRLLSPANLHAALPSDPAKTAPAPPVTLREPPVTVDSCCPISHPQKTTATLLYRVQPFPL